MMEGEGGERGPGGGGQHLTPLESLPDGDFLDKFPDVADESDMNANKPPLVVAPTPKKP
jgi:hypothetical protein